MSTRSARIGGLLALLFGCAGLSIAADTTSPTAPAPSTSGAPTYLTVGDIIGKITKVDANSITVQVTWYTQAPPKNAAANHRMYGNWHHGTSGRNHNQMHQHMQMMQQQMQRQMVAQQKQANAKPTEHHQDYKMNFATDATARVLHLPPKLDANGKKEGYNPEEWQRMKGNAALPGFKADLSELKTGQLVEAHVVRLPGSEKTKDKSDDAIVRWALIINEAAAGQANATAAAPAKKKK